MRNFTDAAKWPLVFFTKKCKILKLHLNDHFFFYKETENFENCTQTAIRFFTTKCRILKVVPERPFVFPTRKYQNLTVYHQFSFFS